MKRIVNLDDDILDGNMSALQTDPDEDENLLIVTFHLGNQIYGAKVKEVQEIITFPVITKVPRTVSFLSGILSLRGKIVPIVDLRKRLGMTEKSSNEGKRVIITNFDNLIIGLIVDKVAEVAKLNDVDINTTPSAVSAVNERYIHSVARYKEKIITILNMKQVCMVTPEEKQYNESELIEKSKHNYLAFIQGKLS